MQTLLIDVYKNLNGLSLPIMVRLVYDKGEHI